LIRRLSILLLFFISVILESGGQGLKGKITTGSGDPVPYATVYIQELRQGTTANTKGDYELKLPSGKYFVTFQSLGYSPVLMDITIADQTIVRNVILPVQYYTIPEVRINASGEDPAYGIMRKAIGMASYYLNNISYYKADVYLKGNLIINRIPKIMQKAINVEARRDQGGSISSNKIKEGDIYLMESYNEIEFTAPDKYVQKVISVNSTFPEQGDNVSPMDLIQASLYEPVIADMVISPLSPQAFSHYNFKYQGATLQGDFTVSKIQVVPKRKSQQLFEGTIYIIDDLWCLHSVDLTNDNIAGKIRIEQLYIPVQDDTWMPVSHKFNMQVSILGFKAEAGYGSSVKYTEVKPNISLRKPESAVVSYISKPVTAQTVPEKPVTKSQEKIEDILQKDELTNRDMVKLSRLMDKESEKSKPDSVRRNLEIKDNTTQIVEKDAARRDSAFWAEIRPIPLSDLELKSIRVRDSVKNENSLRVNIADSTQSAGTNKQKSKFARTLSNIAFGHTWNDTLGFSFTYGGVIKTSNLSFNTVDGFVYGTDFRLSKRWKNNNTLAFYPDVKWAFSRESLMWRISGNYSFNRLKQRQVSFRTGITSRDLSSGGTINPFLNSLTTLFLKDNYLKLYESRYLFAGYRTELINGLYLNINGGYEDRRFLNNTTSFAFSRSEKVYTDNLPPNEYLVPAPGSIKYIPLDQKHYEIVTNVTFTPRQRYTLNKDVKVPRGSDWPTFGFTWKHGINEDIWLPGSYQHYDMFRFQANRTKNIGAFSEFRWLVRAGTFVNNNQVNFYDFFHFNPQPLPLLLNDYQDAFRLRTYYSLSTPELFGEAHLTYTTPYLLLKYLPGLSKTLMRENLTLSYLGSRFRDSYTELGYSVSEISLFGELGIYAGFDNLKFRSFGARLILKL
jgi:hypothetical protein